MAEEIDEVEAPEVVAPAPDVSAEVAALKGKLAQVQAKNAAAAEKAKAVAERLAAFDGIDPENIGKMREAWESTQSSEERAEAARKQMEANAKAEREEIAAEREAWERTRTEARGRLDDAVMNERIGAGIEAAKLQLEVGARESLMLHAKRIFKVDDDMRTLSPIEVMLDKDDKPMTVEKWLGSLVGTHPYLFRGGAGGGAKPGTGGHGPKKQYVRSQLSPAQRTSAIEEIKAGTAEWA